MFINRLFAQAYQSRYPQSLCGCLWTLCSLYQNRPPLLREGAIRPSACSVRDQFAQKKALLCRWKLTIMTHTVYPFYNVRFYYPFAICGASKQVLSPPQNFFQNATLPDCVGHNRQHIPGELDPQKQQFLLPLFPPFLPAALVSSTLLPWIASLVCLLASSAQTL